MFFYRVLLSLATAGCGTAFAQSDNLAIASDGCVSLATLRVPETGLVSQTITSTSVSSPGSVKFEYWWQPCAKGHKHFHDHVLAFKVTAISGSYRIVGNNYVQQGGLEWSVSMAYSAGVSGTLVPGGPYSYDLGVISERTYGTRPSNNPDPLKPIQICAGFCTAGKQLLPPVSTSTTPVMAATYDTATGKLVIPSVAVGTARYAVELALTADSPLTFVVRDAKPLAN